MEVIRSGDVPGRDPVGFATGMQPPVQNVDLGDREEQEDELVVSSLRASINFAVRMNVSYRGLRPYGAWLGVTW